MIENIQREDLNVIDQAIALSKLIDHFNLTHFQLAKTLGKSRTSITNLMRLLELNDEVKSFVISGELRMGHARCLLGISSQEMQQEAATTIINNDLSVREAEKLVNTYQHKIEQQTIPKRQIDQEDDDEQQRKRNCNQSNAIKLTCAKLGKSPTDTSKYQTQS